MGDINLRLEVLSNRVSRLERLIDDAKGPSTIGLANVIHLDASGSLVSGGPVVADGEVVFERRKLRFGIEGGCQQRWEFAGYKSFFWGKCWSNATDGGEEFTWQTIEVFCKEDSSLTYPNTTNDHKDRIDNAG